MGLSRFFFETIHYCIIQIPIYHDRSPWLVHIDYWFIGSEFVPTSQRFFPLMVHLYPFRGPIFWPRWRSECSISMPLARNVPHARDDARYTLRMYWYCITYRLRFIIVIIINSRMLMRSEGGFLFSFLGVWGWWTVCSSFCFFFSNRVVVTLSMGKVRKGECCDVWKYISRGRRGTLWHSGKSCFAGL